MICLQETCLEQNEEFNQKFKITDKKVYLSVFHERMEIKKQNYQSSNQITPTYDYQYI